jgi:hypothetical protein
MRIVFVERFPDPSRRCARDLMADSDDEVVAWDLSPEALEHAPTLADVARAMAAWASIATSPARAWRYVRVAWRMRGWRRTAFLRIPQWVRAARADQVDTFACFSHDGFELPQLLADEAGVPCHEQLAHGTQFFGEFAFELLAVVPYAHWLHEQGRLEFTVSTADTRCLYYFSPRHLERGAERRYVPITEYPVGETGAVHYDGDGFPALLDTSRWSPPPYGEVFADARFEWAKPLVVVGNKTSDERYLGHDQPVNSIPTDTLLELLARLTPTYTVVYNRPREVDIVGDHAVAREVGDIEAVTNAFPEVVTIQSLHAEHSDLSFNELQLRVYAGCRRFVSVLGGGSYLASWFGGTNVVFAQQGWEVDCDAYAGWFHRFSGAAVVAVSSSAELLAAVDEHFLRPRSPDPSPSRS